jgi:hypothetical protein
MINDKLDALYLDAIALVMTAAAKALDAHGALKDHAAVDPGSRPVAAMQQYQECLDALVEACRRYEKIATARALITQLDA